MAARYGLYAMALMARAGRQRVTADATAQAFGISRDHVAKVLQTLVRGELVRSVRGAGGGYTLARDPEQVSMLDVVECLDGPQKSGCDACELQDHSRSCSADPVACSIQRVFSEIEDTAYYTMKSITIATLAHSDAVRLGTRGVTRASGDAPPQPS
jgi:Rrf2 family nitric oxide-sensitive transcriptional repressor